MSQATEELKERINEEISRQVFRNEWIRVNKAIFDKKSGKVEERPNNNMFYWLKQWGDPMSPDENQYPSSWWSPGRPSDNCQEVLNRMMQDGWSYSFKGGVTGHRAIFARMEGQDIISGTVIAGDFDLAVCLAALQALKVPGFDGIDFMKLEKQRTVDEIPF